MHKNIFENYRFSNFPFDDTQMQDLRDGLVFDHRQARISLHGMPMLLLHTNSLSSFRHELIESLGIAKARKLLFRMGQQAGTQDAQVVIKLRSDLSEEDFLMGGPQLHNFTGMTLCKPVKTEINVSKGLFYMEVIWQRSTEAELHIEKYGNENPFPVCWMQLGYASGYASVVMGRPVLYKEAACQGQGDKHCLIIGKLADDWDDDEDGIFSTACDHSGHHPLHSTCDSFEAEGIETPFSPDIVGTSDAFSIVNHQIKKISLTNVTVLFQGESGVGKELFARQLHDLSPRKNEPYISVNCAAIPEDILESELFGVEKGAFTGAVRSRSGRFERANGGTIFLDEIGLLSYSAQGKLLRVLQEFEFERLGGEETIKVDVRVIAATNEDLYSLSHNEHSFRKDLFYRLNVCPIYIPPLRDRASDIPLLMNFFLKKYCKKYNKKITGFTNNTVRALMSYQWEGNIRELENYIERCIILTDNNKAISIDDFPSFRNATKYQAPPPPLSDIAKLSKDIKQLVTTLTDQQASPYKEDLETPESQPASTHSLEQQCHQIFNLIKKEKGSIDDAVDMIVNCAMEEAHGNITEAGRMLGMTRARVAHRIKSIGDDKLQEPVNSSS